MAEKVGKGLAKGWRGVGEGLAKGWRRVGEGLADFLAPSTYLRNSRGARLETLVCDSMVAFHENDGNHENNEDDSDSYKPFGGGNAALVIGPNRVLVETDFGASKALYLKAFRSLKNALTKAR